MPSLPPMQDMLRLLVATPSVSSPDARFDQSNRGVVELIAGWAQALGMQVELLPLAGASDKLNLVATLGQGAGEGGLVLSGHTDTVPYDARGWSHDPFELTQDGDRLYGLGAADMKAFFPAALHAIASVDAGTLRQPLTLLATADEESTMAGAASLAKSGRHFGRAAIIGEPTGLDPVRKHKGVWMVKISIEGRSGHGSDPAQGLNAIEGLGQVITALEQWQHALSERHADHDFSVPHPTINLGRVEGGDSPNRICAHCELDVDMRLLPSMNPDEVARELEAVLGRALGGSWPFSAQATGVHVSPYSLPPHTKFCREVEAITGRPAKAVMFGTEAPFYERLGLETLILGAGDIEVAHQPDEYVRVAAVEEASNLYTKIIQKVCLEAS